MNDRDSPGFDPLVHQAEGALVARLDLPLSEAVSILRAWAAEEGVTLHDMACEVTGTPLDPRRNGHRAN